MKIGKKRVVDPERSRRGPVTGVREKGRGGGPVGDSNDGPDKSGAEKARAVNRGAVKNGRAVEKYGGKREKPTSMVGSGGKKSGARNVNTAAAMVVKK